MTTKIAMPIILITLFTALGCSPDDQPQPLAVQPLKTVVYLIRHAEKADNSANPNLSAAGLERANNWATLLGNVNFEAFYSTNYNRTLQTIEPTAADNGKSVLLYDPASFSLDDVVAQHQGKNVMIVGHSNTIPQLINAYLGEDVYPDMAETEFGNLYKISIVNGVVSHVMTVHN